MLPCRQRHRATTSRMTETDRQNSRAESTQNYWVSSATKSHKLWYSCWRAAQCFVRLLNYSRGCSSAPSKSSLILVSQKNGCTIVGCLYGDQQNCLFISRTIDKLLQQRTLKHCLLPQSRDTNRLLLRGVVPLLESRLSRPRRGAKTRSNSPRRFV